MMETLLEGAMLGPSGWPYRMTICGAYELRQGFVSWQGTHVLSIQRGGARYHGPALPADRHLVLEFDDVTDPSRLDAPTLAHLAAAMAFVDALPAEAALVVHCTQGVSRSTALTLGLLAREVPPMEAAGLLHTLRPFACPNPLVVRLWDDLLGLQGELVVAACHFPTVSWRHGTDASRAAQTEALRSIARPS